MESFTEALAKSMQRTKEQMVANMIMGRDYVVLKHKRGDRYSVVEVKGIFKSETVVAKGLTLEEAEAMKKLFEASKENQNDWK